MLAREVSFVEEKSVKESRPQHTMTIETAPPMAHAVGGSLGSALALLLFYPLERARVELQTMTASADPTDEEEESHLSEDIHNDKVKPLQNQTSRGGGGIVATIPASASEESQSWESCLNRPEEEVISASSSDQEIVAVTNKKLTTKRKQNLGLLACIYRLHQRKQLYRGVTPVVTTMATSNFVFFYMHSFLKQWLFQLSKNGNNSSHQAKPTLRLSLVASALAGICNVLLTNPMWVANLRIVTSSSSNNNDDKHNNNLWQEMKSIVESEGWTHLWNGTPASLLLVSNPVIQFVAYEQLKNRLLQALRQNSRALKPLEAFLLGALAKAISTVFTYPLQLAQTVLRVQKQGHQQQKQLQEEGEPNEKPATSSEASTTPPNNNTTPQPYRGTLDCLFKIYRRKGLEGWFAGMRTKLLQTVLTAAFTFLTYEQIIRAIMAVHRALQDGRRVRNHHHAPVPVP